MKSFLFITTLTPQAYLTPLRKGLQSLFLQALKNQTYKNWSALLIGEEDRTDGNILFIKTPYETKEDKQSFIFEYLKNIKPAPDYLIRLDDDDLISPTALEYIAGLNKDFDCYSDKYHAYYSIVSGKICQVKNAWLPNTVVHKFEHALTCFGKEGKPLYTHDHNETWKEYYRDKKVIWADKNDPLYLRIMSPSAQSSGMHKRLISEFTGDILSEYFNKINKIGVWENKELPSFNRYIPLLKNIWETVSRRSYQMCTHCILDTIDDINIVFDNNGKCNYCYSYDKLKQRHVLEKSKGQEEADRIIEKIKKEGRGRKYDCILGVSGGVDSTYVAYYAKKSGLRPLVVHLDNGWDSEIAIKNIENIVSKLDFDLYTHVIDWEEFRDIQKSFFKASVVDIELLTDHAIIATIYKLARKYKIKYILNGTNIVTEGILPRHWVHRKLDVRNIKSIHKQFGSVKMKTFPTINFFQFLYGLWVLKIESVSILNYLPYDKKNAKEIIMNELGWRDYGGKHYESVFTRFYQAYILPRKFKIDKRKAHLSTLVCSGQITRDQALEEMKMPIFDSYMLEADKEYVMKKLGFTEAEFLQYMNAPPVSHLAFPSYETGMYLYHESFFKTIKPLTALYRVFRKKK